MHYLNSCLYLLLLCLCWHIAVFLGMLPLPVDQWNSMKPLAGMCIVTKNKDEFVKTVLHSTTVAQ